MLEALSVPQGSGWLQASRVDALARLRAAGLPGRRDEYWQYTDPTSLTAEMASPAALFEAGDEPAAFAAVDRLNIVFVDGVFDAEASDDLALAGVEITPLAEAGAARYPLGARSLRCVGKRRADPRCRASLAALNTALATEGMLIRVTGKAAKPVAFQCLHRSETSDVRLHHLVRVEAGAELTLLESGPLGARFSTVMEVEVADGASFHHIRTQGRDHQRRGVSHIFARLGRESRFKTFTMTANGVLTRNEVVIDLTGDDAFAHVAGASVGDQDFHHDDTIFITHDAVGCESRQVFKTVLRNGATGVFQGKILVKPGAQKTDGYQISQSLLLDGDSQFLAKPELEIYADDVKCSHGSTSGAIDETALFYLRSRGVPERAAQALLVLAFLAEAIAEIEDEAIAEDIRAALDRWLARRML